jgi:hypothetical protein
MRNHFVIFIILILVLLLLDNSIADTNNRSVDIEPAINDTLPADNSDNIPVDTEIVVIFSQSMDTTSVKNNFKIFPPVDGDYWWGTNDTIMVFTPKGDLEYSDCGPFEYIIIISKNATNLNGTDLGTDYRFSFVTEVLPGIGKISGYVKDKHGNIFEGAEVFVWENDIKITDSNGYYEIEVPNGQAYQVNAKADGYYGAVNLSEPICVGSNATVNFALEPLENNTDVEEEQKDDINICNFLGFILLVEIIIVLIFYFGKRNEK